MKEIMKEYGSFITTIIAVGLIIAILFSTPFAHGIGVIGEVGTFANKMLVDKNKVRYDASGNEIANRTDDGTLESYAEREYPNIIYDTTKETIGINEELDLNNYLKVSINTSERALRNDELKIVIGQVTNTYSTDKWTDVDTREDACRVFVTYIKRTQPESNEASMSTYYTIKETTGKIIFKEAGIYEVYMKIMDRVGKASYLKVTIPVTNKV